MTAAVRLSRPPPAGPPFPAVIQTLLWTTLPEIAMTYCARRYGDIFTTRLIGNRNYIVVSRPEHVRDVFMNFPAVGNDELRLFLGSNSLFVLDGPRHKRHRKILLPPLRGDHLNIAAASIWARVENALTLLQPGQHISVYDLIMPVTLDVILHAIVGVSEAAHVERYRALVLRGIKQISGPAMYFEFLQRDFGRYSPGGAIRRTQQALHATLAADLESRRRGGHGVANDVMSLLIESRDDEGHPLANEEIVDEVVTLLFAGFDPTTAALAWALYWIHSTDGVAEKIVAELSQTSAPNRHEAVFKNTPYLDAVCKETLRIKPVVPTIERRITQPTRFDGYDLPAGARIAPCAFLTHNRPDLYPEPERFRPERFLERQYSPYEFYPYGGSHRHCLGSQYSFFQLKHVLAALLTRCRFEIYGGRRISAAQRGATLGPSAHLKLRLVEWR